MSANIQVVFYSMYGHIYITRALIAGRLGRSDRTPPRQVRRGRADAECAETTPDRISPVN